MASGQSSWRVRRAAAHRVHWLYQAKYRSWGREWLELFGSVALWAACYRLALQRRAKLRAHDYQHLDWWQQAREAHVEAQYRDHELPRPSGPRLTVDAGVIAENAWRYESGDDVVVYTRNYLFQCGYPPNHERCHCRGYKIGELDGWLLVRWHTGAVTAVNPDVVCHPSELGASELSSKLAQAVVP